MKIGLVSDVHNQVRALTYALEQLRDCDLLLNLGDLVSEYRVEPEIIRVAQLADLAGIQGNHEKTVLFHPGTTLRDRLAPDDLQYLAALPASRELWIDGLRVVVAHGAPWDDPLDYRCEYLFEQNQSGIDRLRAVDADVILLGHTHRPMLLKLGETLVVNPGSCGESRGDPHCLTYGKLDFAMGQATIFEIRFGDEPRAIASAAFQSAAA